MTPQSLRRRCSSILTGAILPLAALVLAPAVHAATWTGAVDTSWGNAGNWTGTTPDNSATSQPVIFNAGTNLTTTLDALNYNLTTFNKTASTGTADAVVVNVGSVAGGTLTFTAGSTSTASTFDVVNSDDSALTINPDIISTANLDGTGANGRLTLSVAGTGALTVGNVTHTTGVAGASNSLVLRGAGGGLGTVSGTINIAGALLKTDTSTWSISSTSNSIGGPVSLAVGTLKIAADGSLGSASNALNIGQSTTTATLVYNGTGDTTARTINLVGTTGGATIDQSGTGLLKYTSNINSTGAGSKTLTLQGSTTGTGEISGAIADSSATNKTSMTKAGTGTWTLSGANTYTGSTNINGGTLNVGSSGALGSTGTIAFGGGTLQYSAANTTDYSSRFSTGASQAYKVDTNSQSVTWASALTSSGGTLTKIGAGTLTLSGANTYTGRTEFIGGTIAAVSNTSFGNGASSLRFSGGTIASSDATARTFANPIDLNQTMVTGGSGNLLFTGNAALGNATGGAKTITVNNALTELSGVLSSTDTAGSLTKDGPGTLILSGANTYQKSTNINAGTLITANASALGVGSVSVGASGTLQVGNGTVNTLTLGPSSAFSTTTGATLKLAMDSSAVTMGATGTFNLANDTKLDITGLVLANTPGSYIIVDGPVGGSSSVGLWNQATDLIGGNTSSFTYSIAYEPTGNDAVLTVETVPEPGAVTALLGGIGVLLGFGRGSRRP